MTTNNSDLLHAVDQALDGRSLTWAAQWIEDSLKGETNERVIEFGKNMAMTLRAATLDAAPIVATGDNEGEKIVATEADAIVLNALETHGSQVIYDSEKKVVVACPVSSLCEGTTDHEPDCWIGQATRYMPTSDCERALAAAALRTQEGEGK